MERERQAADENRLIAPGRENFTTLAGSTPREGRRNFTVNGGRISQHRVGDGVNVRRPKSTESDARRGRVYFGISLQPKSNHVADGNCGGNVVLE